MVQLNGTGVNQKHLNMGDPNNLFKITITNGQQTVKAPLPADFGITVGSEYTAPFDTMSINDNLQKILAIKNFSRKAGIKMKKYYANPEMTEISFDMEFVAFYSTQEEVIMPVYNLMSMAVGRDFGWQSLKNTIDQVIRAVNAGIDEGEKWFGTEFLDELDSSDLTGPGVQASASRALDFITIITGPEPVTVQFGRTLTLRDAFVSSVTPRFGNILDPNGWPQSCICSVTCILQSAPTSSDPEGNPNSGNIERWLVSQI